MLHIFEHATTGRARCRGCGKPIPAGELRFGERIPNPFAEGETTLWFHPLCAAYKRPEPLLEALAQGGASVHEREHLEHGARLGLAHRRVPRIDGAERAPSAQAKCRHCHQPIARASWRIRLVFFEDGRFSPGGFVHLECRKAYFEIDDVLERLIHFSPGASDAERDELRRAFDADPGATPAPQAPS